MILLWRENNIQSISKQNEGGRRRNETPHPVVKKHQRKKLRGEYDYFSDPLFTPKAKQLLFHIFKMVKTVLLLGGMRFLNSDRNIAKVLL